MGPFDITVILLRVSANSPPAFLCYHVLLCSGGHEGTGHCMDEIQPSPCNGHFRGAFLAAELFEGAYTAAHNPQPFQKVVYWSGVLYFYFFLFFWMILCHEGSFIYCFFILSPFHRPAFLSHISFNFLKNDIPKYSSRL